MRGGSGAGCPGAGGGPVTSVSPFAKSRPYAGLHAERVEQMLVDVRGTHAQGTIAGEEIRLASRERADGRKRPVELAILHVFGRRDPELVEAERRELSGQIHQAFRLWIRERLQEHAVDDGKDRGVGANAERERQHGDGRKPWTAAQHAQPVPNIAHHIVEHGLIMPEHH